MTDRIDSIEFARARRQMADEFERLMWQHLRNRNRCGKKFRREHPLGVCTADFYCAATKLVIEVDGLHVAGRQRLCHQRLQRFD